LSFALPRQRSAILFSRKIRIIDTVVESSDFALKKVDEFDDPTPGYHVTQLHHHQCSRKTQNRALGTEKPDLSYLLQHSCASNAQLWAKTMKLRL
jgi:hypothetical protein